MYFYNENYESWRDISNMLFKNEGIWAQRLDKARFVESKVWNPNSEG